MQIPIVVEAIGSEHFRAQGLPPFTAFAEGATSDEAVSKVREQLHREIEAGKRVVMVEIPSKEENPWLALAGSLKDNPLYDEWRAAIEEFRRERDIEDGIDVPERT
jgi:hypothetical protein